MEHRTGGTPRGSAPPWRAEAERHRRWLAGRAPSGSATGEQGPLLLVVEDDASTRAALQALLELGGYRVVTTPLAEEAIRIAPELVPDAVLLDLVLPRMNGLDTARWLKGHPATAGIPVIAMTGLWLGEYPAALTPAGFDAALRKPFSGAELFGELEWVLSPALAERGQGAA